MEQFRGIILLFLAVAVGSAIPFVPTGEMVSGAAAVASHSRLPVHFIFVATFIASTIGDTLLLIEARLGARWLRPWLARRKFNRHVERAQQALVKNPYQAIITGRLIPGGRTPVVIALALSRFPIRRVLLPNAIACALWALIYSTIGSIGGRLVSHPIWAMVIAITFAISVGALVQQVARLVGWLQRRRRRQEAP